MYRSMDQTETARNEVQISAESRPAAVAALNLLVESQELAKTAAKERWTFAVELPYLLAAGSTVNVLRWLTQAGWLEHRIETTLSGSKRRRFRTCPWFSLSAKSCFVLTDKGLAAAALWSECQQRPTTIEGDGEKSVGAANRSIEKPLWESGPGRLWARTLLLHQFPHQASSVRLFLTACQEDGWEEWIASPFPPSPSGDAQRRLRDAVNRLNHCQNPRLLRFRVQERGDAASWEWLDPGGNQEQINSGVVSPPLLT
jgi:hypothetical protein